MSGGAANNKLTIGEVCTQEAAVKLGIADYQAFLGSTRINNFDPRCTNQPVNTSFCKAGTSNNSSNYVDMHCSISAGIGYIRNGDECKTVGCPPGFRKRGDACETEPLLKDFYRDKRGFCQERWYDWFTIPNYHLGNNYSNVNDITKNAQDIVTSNLVTCFRPCPAGSTPVYHIDPNDNESIGDGINRYDKCIDKGQYMVSKYANTDDYCPLAAVHALTMKKTDAIQQFDAVYDDYVKNVTAANSISTSNEKIHTVLTSTDSIGKDAIFVQDVVLPSIQKDVIISKEVALKGSGGKNQFAQQACANLDTPARVEYAYGKCRSLLDRGDDAFGGDSLVNSKSVTPTEQIKNLKKACNALFCNPSSTAYDSFDPTQETSTWSTPVDEDNKYICFTDIEATDVPDQNEDPYDPENNKPPQLVTEMYTVMPSSFKIGLFLAVLPFAAFALYIILTNAYAWYRLAVWKAIRPAFHAINMYIFCSIRTVLNAIGFPVKCNKALMTMDYQKAEYADEIWWLSKKKAELLEQKVRIDNPST